MPPVRALGTRTIFEDLTKYDDLRYKVESLSPLRINNDDEQEWSVTLHKHAIDL